jgi:hypothetical protein
MADFSNSEDEIPYPLPPTTPIAYGIMPGQNWVGTLDDGWILEQAVSCWHFDADIIKVLENLDDYLLPVLHPCHQWHGCQTEEGL